MTKLGEDIKALKALGHEFECRLDRTSKRQRALKVVQEGVYHVQTIGIDPKFFEFPVDSNAMLGRDPEASPLQIYMRNENWKVAGFLDKFVASSKLRCYLQGPPGVGKTKVSLIWMLQSLLSVSGDDSNELWAWIPLTTTVGTEKLSEVYLLDRSGADTVRFRLIHTSHVANDLMAWGVKIAVFGNCNEGNIGPIEDCKVLRVKCIVVSALQVKLESGYGRQMSYTVNGWTEAEYLEACKDDTFYDSVKASLWTEEFSELELDDPALRSEIVTAKYHLAGGSARWMFQFSSEQLLSSSGDFQSIAYQLGRASVAQIKSGRVGDNISVIVSQYVANHMVLRYGEALLKNALLLLYDSSSMDGVFNPALDGVLLQMDFLLRLGRSEPKKNKYIDLIEVPGGEPVPLLQSGSNKIQYRLSTFASATITVADGDWFIPQIVNNGGFDCVQYREGKLIFVQVARSAAPLLKLKWYEKFRSAFVAKFPALVVAQCEVWFVVPEGLVGTFNPAVPTDELTGFNKYSSKVVGLVGLRRITA